MSNPSPRSAGVTAAATYAILCCLTALGFWGYIFLSLINSPADYQGRHLYQKFPGPFLLVALVPPALIALGIRTAIGLFQLRPWARVAALVWAAFSLILCLALIAYRPFETLFIPHRFVREAELFKQMVAISFLLLILPVSVWWLFLFRAKSVKLQFLSAESESPVMASCPQKS
ncbi:MAG TPA: hypothetical protein VED66_05245 [Candidatus Sulfotelmatobacter sp.]|nr:hypothetical protein [Candidatus Sulfotelmatobacter sp.]